MATFQFNLVSPEKLLVSGEVNQVDVPGSVGDFGVLAGHAPFVTTLRPGILTIYREGGALRVAVSGGFAEVSDAGLTVLADVAVPVEDVNREAFAGYVKEAEAALASAPEGPQRDRLALRADQLRQLQATLSQ
jgi:F-type H+-transporting ATPase subunit epsilon